MKLGFWTLGMPNWSTAEAARRAAELGYDGIDLRCTRPGIDGQPAGGGNLSINSSDAAIEQLVSDFDEHGVEIASLLTYWPFGAGDRTDWALLASDIDAHARLARRVGTNLMRVQLGQPDPGGSWADHLERLWPAVQAGLSDVPGVRVTLENHPGRASGEELFVLAEQFDDPRVGLVYSLDNAFVMQEDNVALIERFSEHILEVCFSDRRVVTTDLARFDGRFYYVQYEECMVGEGDLPLAEILSALAAESYAGYVSLQWKKSDTFGHHLAPGEEALEAFANVMNSLDVLGPRRATAQ